MKMLTIWARVGGAVVLVFLLGLLVKGVADVGELKGTVSALASRMDTMQTDINARFVQIENRMDRRFEQMDNRLVRIENILMGRSPNADGVSDAGAPAPASRPATPARHPSTKPRQPSVS